MTHGTSAPGTPTSGGAMTPERWQLTKELLFAALQLPPDQRASFLDERCGVDTTLRAEVDALLAAGADAPTILNASVSDLAALVGDDADVPADVPAGRRFGPYRVLRPIGRGGMGTVYLAVREEPFTQYVALKVVRRGVDAGPMLQRFEMERQILASLNDPSIARLLDGGTTEAGVPYLVMEYVEGVPITDYCDRARLTVDARLRLFQHVCRAVQHAHQNLVVHRDLKPSNILVEEADGRPRVKLLDFGVAKLLDPALSPVGVPITETLVRVMTPEYAAPEQVRGDTVTTATDVYALGVLLYELLTGRRPYRLTSRSLSEVERVICESEPERPSTRVTKDETVSGGAGQEETITAGTVSAARATEPARLRRRLSGDLDNIVLMAMRKEPPLRYGSPERLAADLDRYLNGLPVEARPSTVGYRARKFVRRHRAAVTMGLAILALLAGAAIRERTLRGEAERARDLARLEAEKSKRVTSFLLGLFEANDPNEARGQDITARTLMDRGAARLEALREEPAVQAQTMNVVGDIYVSLGQYDRAEPLLRQALESRRQLPSAQPLDIAASLQSLGKLQLQKSEYAEAERSFREALALRRAAFGPRHADVASLLTDLAAALSRKGSYDEAAAVQREALAMQRELLGPEHLDVAKSLNSLAMIVRRQGDYKAAEGLYAEALALKRRVVGNEHSEVALGLNNVAFMRAEQGDFAGAEPLYREALALNRKLYGESHVQVANNLNNLAALYYRQRDFDAAESTFREALDMRRRLLGDTHPDVSESLNNLAVVRRARGDYAGSESLFRQVLAIDRARLGPEHPFVATTLSNLGHVLHKRGDYAQAERVLRDALAMRQKLLGPDHPDVAITMATLAALLADTRRSAEAEQLYLGSLQIMTRRFDQTHARVQETYRALVGLYERSGKPDKAAEYRARLAPAPASTRN